MSLALPFLFVSHFLHLFFVLLQFRSVTEGGLWSLALENYIRSNSLEGAAVRKLYSTVNRSVMNLFKTI